MTESNVTDANSGASLTRLPARRNSFRPPDVEIHSNEHAERVRPAAAIASELHVHQIFGILRRRWRLVVAMAILGAMLAGVATVMVPPKFTARAQIVVEPGRTASSGRGATRVAGVDALAIDTQMTMLTARDHLRAVLISLADDPTFSQTANEQQSGAKPMAPTPDQSRVQKERLFAELERWVTGLIARIRTLISQKDAIPTFDEFERTLRVDQERRSRVITIRYTSKSPEQAAAIANRVVELYVHNQTERVRAASKTELAQLESRIADVERTLAAAEHTIRQKLTTSQISADTDQVSGVPLRQLERNVAEKAQLYVDLLQRQKQIRSQPETTEASIRILSLAAPPERPSSPNPKFFILPTIILALIGGGVLAVINERFDRTLRSEHQVQSTLGIPLVAMVPKLGWIPRKRPYRYLLRKPFSPYAEAIRSIGASLQFAAPGQAPQFVLVSSSVPGEGRTTLATSLAVYATRLNRRVLLIDLDFRHPAVMRALKLKGDRGILDLIVSNNPFDEIVRPIPDLGLDVLPMPSCPVDPVTLFANGELQAVLQEIRKSYDFVVIDGPPLLGVTESSLLASLVDTVLFVVKWGSTRRDVAQNAISELHALGWSDQTIAERVRAVVTQVDLMQHARYQYGDAVELFVKHRQRYRPPQKMLSLADLSKTDDVDEPEETSPVAAE